MSSRHPRMFRHLASATALLVALAGALPAQGGPDRPQLDDLVRKLAFADRAGLEALRAHPATALPGDEGGASGALPVRVQWIVCVRGERDLPRPSRRTCD